jgi:hypothetical protein
LRHVGLRPTVLTKPKAFSAEPIRQCSLLCKTRGRGCRHKRAAGSGWGAKKGRNPRERIIHINKGESSSVSRLYTKDFACPKRCLWFRVERRCAHARCRRCGDTVKSQTPRTIAGPRAMLSPGPAKRLCPDLAPTNPPLVAPSQRASEKPASGDLGFSKRESPFRQLRDERGELRRCPFVHMHEDVVLRFVRLLEELVLDIRILFRTWALWRQGVP